MNALSFAHTLFHTMRKAAAFVFFTDFCRFFSYLIFSEKKIPCLHVPSYITHLRGPQQPGKVSSKTEESEILFLFLLLQLKPQIDTIKIFLEKKTKSKHGRYLYKVHNHLPAGRYLIHQIFYTTSFTYFLNNHPVGSSAHLTCAHAPAMWIAKSPFCHARPSW